MKTIIYIIIGTLISACVSTRSHRDINMLEKEIDFLNNMIRKMRHINYEEKWRSALNQVSQPGDYKTNNKISCIAIFFRGEPFSGLTCPATPREPLSLRDTVKKGNKCFVRDFRGPKGETFIKLGRPMRYSDLQDSVLYWNLDGDFFPTYVDKVNKDKYLVETVSDPAGPAEMEIVTKQGLESILSGYEMVKCSSFVKFIPIQVLPHTAHFENFIISSSEDYQKLHLDEDVVKMIRNKKVRDYP